MVLSHLILFGTFIVGASHGIQPTVCDKWLPRASICGSHLVAGVAPQILLPQLLVFFNVDEFSMTNHGYSGHLFLGTLLLLHWASVVVG